MACHVMCRGTYGRYISLNNLHNSGFSCSEKRIAILIEDAGICSDVHINNWQTTFYFHAASYPENLLVRNCKGEAAYRTKVTDITYIPMKLGWLYMSVVMLLHSRRFEGWSFLSKLEASIVTKALAIATNQRNATSGLLMYTE
jgi:putative transposase